EAAGAIALSAGLADHLGDRCGDDGPLEPTFQSPRILLGQDALARPLPYRDATSPEHGEHSARAPDGFPLMLRFLELLGPHLPLVPQVLLVPRLDLRHVVLLVVPLLRLVLRQAEL